MLVTSNDLLPTGAIEAPFSGTLLLAKLEIYGIDPPWLGCPCCDSPMYPWAAPLLRAPTANAGLFIQASKQVSAAAIDIWLASSAAQKTRRLLGYMTLLRLRSYKSNLQESSTDWELFMRISKGQSHGIASCKTLSLGHGKCFVRGYQKHLLDQSKQSVLLGKLFWSWQDCKRFQSCTKTERQAFECTFQFSAISRAHESGQRQV